jgi:hypothetical protein
MTTDNEETGGDPDKLRQTTSQSWKRDLSTDNIKEEPNEGKLSLDNESFPDSGDEEGEEGEDSRLGLDDLDDETANMIESSHQDIKIIKEQLVKIFQTAETSRQ